jgi:hypothetical protein
MHLVLTITLLPKGQQYMAGLAAHTFSVHLPVLVLLVHSVWSSFISAWCMDQLHLALVQPPTTYTTFHGRTHRTFWLGCHMGRPRRRTIRYSNVRPRERLQLRNHAHLKLVSRTICRYDVCKLEIFIKDHTFSCASLSFMNQERLHHLPLILH